MSPYRSTSVLLGQIALGGKVVATPNTRRTKTMLRARSARVLRLIATHERDRANAEAIAASLGVPLEWDAIVSAGKVARAEAVEPPVPLACVAALVDFVAGKRDKLHDEQHAWCVSATGLDLAANVDDVDAELITLFGLLHDSQVATGRKGHGGRAADYARSLSEAGVLDLEPDRLTRLCYALEEHSNGLVSDDPTIAACWDADRLPLARAGGVPVDRLLSTAAARTDDARKRAAARRLEPVDWEFLAAW